MDRRLFTHDYSLSFTVLVIVQVVLATEKIITFMTVIIWLLEKSSLGTGQVNLYIGMVNLAFERVFFLIERVSEKLPCQGWMPV